MLCKTSINSVNIRHYSACLYLSFILLGVICIKEYFVNGLNSLDYGRLVVQRLRRKYFVRGLRCQQNLARGLPSVIVVGRLTQTMAIAKGCNLLVGVARRSERLVQLSMLPQFSKDVSSLLKYLRLGTSLG